ncbi:hypothetical protein GS445_17970 [Rhodococcus hoagii]|nr:hypothetical protein [Prescottella equi]
MCRNAEMMIHDAWGYCGGNAAEVRKYADELDRVSDNIASIYADRTDATTEEWRDVMRDEVWYSADEAVTAGLADRVEAKKKDSDKDNASASFDLSIFNYAGRRAAPAPSHSPSRRAPPHRARGSGQLHRRRRFGRGIHGRAGRRTP